MIITDKITVKDIIDGQLVSHFDFNVIDELSKEFFSPLGSSVLNDEQMRNLEKYIKSLDRYDKIKSMRIIIRDLIALFDSKSDKRLTDEKIISTMRSISNCQINDEFRRLTNDYMEQHEVDRYVVITFSDIENIPPATYTRLTRN